MKGQDFLDLAGPHADRNEDYVLGANAETENPRYKGPWDCAEFVTYIVYWITRALYGCVDNNVGPKRCDAYTGAWARDVRNGVVREIPVEEAMDTPGAILLRVKTAQRGGHIVFVGPDRTTIEAHSSADGVCRLSAEGRTWHYGILIPGVLYQKEG